ncbi:MAG: T9SS type A sorting domain-containing protein, partial [Bacteroidota bacterium]
HAAALVAAIPFIVLALYITIPGNEEKKLPGDVPAIDLKERAAWENARLQDPALGRIPENMRRLELEYAATLPGYSDNNQLKNLSWLHRGPYNVGGRTRGAAIDIANENIIMAGGVSGGMWRSEDGGNTWHKTSGAGQLHSVTCLKQDTRPGKTATWYFGTGEGYGGSASAPGAYFLGDGLFRSDDNGQSWASVPSTSVNVPNNFTSSWQIVWNVALDPSVDTADIIYAAIYGKVMRSADGGNTWTSPVGGDYSYFSDVAVTTGGTAYAALSSDGTKAGIWRSTDGLIWTNITPAGFPAAYDRIVMGINPMNENSVYFLGVSLDTGQQSITWQGDTVYHCLWKYTWLSGDGTGAGGLWTNLSANIPNTGISRFDNFYAQGSYDLVVKVKPDDSLTVFIGGTNLYRSTDGFYSSANTKQVGGYKAGTSLPNFEIWPQHHPDQHHAFFLPSDPNVLFTASDGGLHKTLNCMDSLITWQSLNNGYLTSQLYTVNFDRTSASDILIGGFQDNGNFFVNSPDPQASWVMTLNGDGAHSAIEENGSIYYQSIQNGKLYKMAIDAAGNPTAFRRIDPIGASGYQFINQIAVDPNNPDVMYVPAGKYLWRNDSLTHIPMTGTYDSISMGWFRYSDSASYMTSVATAVAVSQNPADIVYVGTSNRKVYRIDNASQGDQPWVDISSVYFPTGGFINCIEVDPLDAGRVMLVFSNYGVYSLFFSVDSGQTWVKSAGNLEQYATGSGNGPSLRWAEIVHVGGDTIYFVSSSTGIYATNKMQGLATVWTQVGAAEIGNVVCEMIRFRETDGLLVVASHGTGIYTTQITGWNDVVSDENVNHSIFRTGIYPNPASDYINIESDEPVNWIGIYSVNGMLVREYKFNELTNRNMKIDVSDLPAGVWYIRIQSGKQITGGKFIKL